MFQLRWIGPDGQPETFELLPPSVTIGRRAENQLSLPFQHVSGHHARMEFQNGAWTITDLHSTNGTTVNGMPADGTTLSQGDQIVLGRLQMHFEDPGATSGATLDDRTIASQHRAFATLENLSPGAGSELEKLSLLLDLQVHWEEGFTGDATIHRILESALTVSGAERACLLLRRGDDFDYSAGRDSTGNSLAEANFHASRSVVAEVVSRGQPVFMTEGLEGAFAEQKSIVAQSLRAIGCMPLRRRDGEGQGLLGILYLDSRAAMHTLSGLDQRILGKLASEAEAVLERMEFIGMREERQRIERELELARQTQEGLLPKRIPDLDGWSLDAFCRPTRHVGGDFFDFIPLPDGRIATMIADVSGKGVAASLVSSSVQGALQMMLRDGISLKDSFRRVNDYLCERSEEGRFVTLFTALLAADGAVSWSSAGHNPAYLYRAATGEVEELGASGTILGSFPSDIFHLEHGEHAATLSKGDILLIYSDGLTEATGPQEEMFEEERVIDILRSSAAKGAHQLREEILAAVEAFTKGEEQSDDITLVIAERVA